VLYAHKGSLVSVNEVEEDGKLLTSFGLLSAFKGDFIITHVDGTTMIIDKKTLDNEYEPVERVKSKVDIEQMAANYAQDWSNIEDQDYIDTFQESVRKRNKLNNN
jgi:hypothetical protein